VKTISAIYENGAFHPTVPITLPERTAVEVVLPDATAERLWGDGLRRCAGSLADVPDLDDDLREIIRQRALDLGRGLGE
jgi:predicted DNA-binding antitoxin AbrB/MazE fold protein